MIKAVVVGYGSIGRRHVKNLLNLPDIQVIICTKRKDLKEIKNRKVIVYRNLEKCLKEKPSIGFVTNETSKHIQTATILAQNGVDIFLEKPLSDSMKGVEKLLKIVKKKKLITQMGCNLRFYPPIVKIKKLRN